MVTLRIVKIGWKPQDVVLMKGSKKDIKNGNYMMINHDIATVREFMFCKVGLCRLFLQLIKEKLTNLNKFPPLNYHKILIPPSIFLSPLLEFQKKVPPINMSRLKSCFTLSHPSLQRSENNYQNNYFCRFASQFNPYVSGNIDQSANNRDRRKEWKLPITVEKTKSSTKWKQ